jgi:hypothetical protein
MAKPINIGRDGVIFLNFLKPIGRFIYRLLRGA